MKIRGSEGAISFQVPTIQSRLVSINICREQRNFLEKTENNQNDSIDCKSITSLLHKV